MSMRFLDLESSYFLDSESRDFVDAESPRFLDGESTEFLYWLASVDLVDPRWRAFPFSGDLKSIFFLQSLHCSSWVIAYNGGCLDRMPCEPHRFEVFLPQCFVHIEVELDAQALKYVFQNRSEAVPPHS